MLLPVVMFILGICFDYLLAVAHLLPIVRLPGRLALVVVLLSVCAVFLTGRMAVK